MIMLRTPKELALKFASMKWGDGLAKLQVTANEAHELGKAFIELEEAYATLAERYDLDVNPEGK